MYNNYFIKMYRCSIVLFLLFIDFIICAILNNKFVYNDNTKVTFSPLKPAEYFGYSVFLTDTGDNKSLTPRLIVGAPKANSTRFPSVRSGRVFTCSIQHAVLSSHKATCNNLLAKDDYKFNTLEFLKQDMFFGATVGAVKNKIVFACGPSFTDSYSDTHLLPIGACYAYIVGRREQILKPLQDRTHYAYSSPGLRKEYKDDDTSNIINYYAFGLAGMAMKITDDSNVLLGAPGILKNTGGIVDYFIVEKGSTIRKQPIANPYFTYDLGPDDYFGYSVESAKFEPNGTFLQVGGAPRSKMGLGQVLIIEPVIIASDPLRIKAKLVGTQLGSYFGAALCCVDVNGDHRMDLLVGAPNYVRKEDGTSYDQGAVFIFINYEMNSTFKLEEAGYVLGNGKSGARFGNAIASLGDIDGDGYNDVAIGAPWEDNGAVYIYQGSKTGLKRNYIQRITAEGAKGFGISISKGQDVDNNLCNDVAIGAYASGTVYLYKCTPTIQVDVSIKLQDISEMPVNATSFTAYFCLSVRAQVYQHLKLELQAIKTVDPDLQRCTILEDTSSTVILTPGREMCDEHEIMVNTTTDLTKPIPITYELKLITPQDSARLSEDSKLQASAWFQMIGDCGKDLICTPLLSLTMEPYIPYYVPGTDQKLGVKVNVTNHAEPAYGVKFNLTLPLIPKRVPTSCALQDFNMTCHLPALFRRNETATFEVELEYENLGHYSDLMMTATMRFGNNVTIEELELKIRPMANITLDGKPASNVTVKVSREALFDAENVTFVHSYQINNLGPSDWYNLKATLFIPDKINLSRRVVGCEVVPNALYMDCEWDIAAKDTLDIIVSLRLDLQKFGDYLKETETFNATSEIRILAFKKTMTVTTTLILDPPPPYWPIIVGVACGILLIILISLGLYKCGFFSRPKKEDLKRLIEEDNDASEPGPSGSDSGRDVPDFSPENTTVDADQSTRELIELDSD